MYEYTYVCIHVSRPNQSARIRMYLCMHVYLYSHVCVCIGFSLCVSRSLLCVMRSKHPGCLAAVLKAHAKRDLLKRDPLTLKIDLLKHKRDLLTHKRDLLTHKIDQLTIKRDLLIHKSDLLLHKETQYHTKRPTNTQCVSRLCRKARTTICLLTSPFSAP